MWSLNWRASGAPKLHPELPHRYNLSPRLVRGFEQVGGAAAASVVDTVEEGSEEDKEVHVGVLVEDVLGGRWVELSVVVVPVVVVGVGVTVAEFAVEQEVVVSMTCTALLSSTSKLINSLEVRALSLSVMIIRSSWV
uniref:Uncharacterized protein n=1 Tax=Cacopsylla melanoneura TaxID=428564 RepID=A0A8D9AU94_9HEMI